ncbi:MAG: HAD-IA family hydrolase [Gammaproteobacteria bacterium]
MRSSDYSLLVFDWDGTLMDSEAQIVRCMQAAMGDMDLPVLEPERIRDIIGLGLKEAIDRLFPGRDDVFHARMVDRYRHHWLASGTGSALFAGAEQTLRQLAQRGYLLGVATGKGRQGLDRVLAETGLGELFHATRCSDETRSKPHPLMLQQIMAELDVAPTETLMIGDTEYDMRMAHNAGAGALAVAYGVHAPERLLGLGPLGCLERIDQLVPWLDDVTARSAAG